MNRNIIINSAEGSEGSVFLVNSLVPVKDGKGVMNLTMLDHGIVKVLASVGEVIGVRQVISIIL